MKKKKQEVPWWEEAFDRQFTINEIGGPQTDARVATPQALKDFIFHVIKEEEYFDSRVANRESKYFPTPNV